MVTKGVVMPNDDRDKEQSDQRKDLGYTEGTIEPEVDSTGRRPLSIHPPDDKDGSEPNGDD